jgi:hypothetical protein
MVRKFASFAIIAVSVGSLLYFLFENYSNFHFGNVLASQEVTSGMALQSFRNWMAFHESRISPFIKSCENAGKETRKDVGDGSWSYVAILEKDRRYEFRGFGKCLGEMWINKLQELGYFKEPQKRPDPMLLTDFIIREPNGRTWVSSQAESGVKTKQLFTLIVMMGISNDDWDVRPCMRVKRGTFSYAVAFSGVVRKLTEDEKLEISCGDDAEARVMAAEMLLSLIPLPRTNAATNTFDSRAYEAMLEELAKPVSVGEKRSLFESFRANAERLFKAERQDVVDEGSPEALARADRQDAGLDSPVEGDMPDRVGANSESTGALGSSVVGGNAAPERFTGFLKYAPAYLMCVLLVGVGLIPVCVSSGQVADSLMAMKGGPKATKGGPKTMQGGPRR